MKTRLSLLLPLFLAACHKPPAGPPMSMPPAPVTLAPVEEKQIVEWDEFTGRVEALETVELRPRVSGYITEVKFQAGELVKKDDVLFIIDPRPFKTKLEGATAEVTRAEAVAQAAQSTLQGANNSQQASGELARMAAELQSLGSGSSHALAC